MRASRSPYLFLILLAVICSLGSGFHPNAEGKLSLSVSAHRLEKPEVKREREPGRGHLSGRFWTQGITADAISQYRDTEGIQHMMIMVSPELYADLERHLDEELVKRKATISKTTREHDPLIAFIISGASREKISNDFLFWSRAPLNPYHNSQGEARSGSARKAKDRHHHR